MTERHLLIVGAGSAGRRHLKNFSNLGCRVSAVDPREDRLREAGRDCQLSGRYADLDHALTEESYDAVVICSPPRVHVEQSLAAMNRGIGVFLEKPVGLDAPSAQRLLDAWRARPVPALLGYTWRWWPAILDLKSDLLSGVVGRVLHVRFVLSAHLADWHPWERYQDFFMSSRQEGGGALLDESHFIDLMLWFFGMPDAVTGSVERLSSLEIDTDDTVDARFWYPDGLRVSMHLDIYGRPHDRSITVVGDRGTMAWTYDPNRLRLGVTPAGDWTDRTYSSERNEMFVSAAREFLDVMSGRRASCTFEDGYRVMRVIESIRESSKSGQRVAVR